MSAGKLSELQQAALVRAIHATVKGEWIRSMHSGDRVTLASLHENRLLVRRTRRVGKSSADNAYEYQAADVVLTEVQRVRAEKAHHDARRAEARKTLCRPDGSLSQGTVEAFDALRLLDAPGLLEKAVELEARAATVRGASLAADLILSATTLRAVAEQEKKPAP